MEVHVVRALRALVTAARRAAALHHPPQPVPGWTLQTRISPPGVRARHRDPAGVGQSPAPAGSGGAFLRWWPRSGATYAGALAAILLGVSLPATAHAQVPPPPPKRVRPLNAGSVDVTPDGDPLLVGVGAGGVAYFSMFNNTNATVTYTLTCAVAGVVNSCGIDADMVTLDPFETRDNLPVTYTTRSSAGDGTLIMYATGIFSDSGWYAVTAAHPAAPTLTQPRQPDSVFNRAHCVTSSAGIADWSCGDALFMLSTPSYTTLDKARNLTLTYASSTASPQPLVSVNVDVAPGGPVLSAIRAVLTVHDTVRTTATYAAWGDGIRQLVVGWNAGSAPTGAYPYTLTIRSLAGTDSTSASVSGNLLVVNRSSSPYGAGWEWLGVERLVLNQPVGSGSSNILWVDGDGSAKLYRSIGGNKWVAPAEEYRDTIAFASGEYTRTLRHGVQVIFDSTGRHVRTNNRQTQVTNFYWRSATQLDSVRVPPAGAGGKTFILHYNGSSVLDSVRVGGRDVGVTISSGNLSQWRWPDATFLSFHTNSGSGKVDSTFADDSAATRLYYGTHGLVDTAKVWYGPVASPSASITVFKPWQAQGYVGTVAADTSLVFTSILGPRGVGDSAQFHVDRWGAPLSVFDADHQTTRFIRGDANVPALITAVHFPNARHDTMTYNSRGNLLTWIDSTADTTTSFKRQQKAWTYPTSGELDSPASVMGTDSTFSQFAYNSFGLTDTMIDQRHNRTTYSYFSSGASVGLLSTITEDFVPVWIEGWQAVHSLRQLVTTLTRDTSGNVITVQNPAGGITKYSRDATFGFPTQVDDAVGMRTRYGYDTMGRLLTHRVIFAVGDASNGCVNQLEFVCGDSAIVGSLNPTGDSATTTMTYTHGPLESCQ